MTLQNTQSALQPHPDPNIDLVAIPIAQIFDRLNAEGLNVEYGAFDWDMIANDSFYRELAAIENIIMVGYPIGLWDFANNNPIVRRGITATATSADFQGRREFVIDCACFPGSSGSPVMLYDVGGYSTKDGSTVVGPSRIKLLGILWGGPQFDAAGRLVPVNVPTAVQPMLSTRIPTNLGFCVKATELFHFEKVFRAMMASQDAREKDALSPPPSEGPNGGEHA